MSLPEKIEHTDPQGIRHRLDLIIQDVALLVFDPADGRAIQVNASCRQAPGQVFQCDGGLLCQPLTPDTAANQVPCFYGGGLFHASTGGFHPLTISAFLFECGWTSPTEMPAIIAIPLTFGLISLVAGFLRKQR